jgi:tetratricopeptide (TPR) repeat protein
VPHFELYTQLDRPQAMQALRIFEQARTFFQQAGFSQSGENESITILDLGSESEYKAYLVKPGAFAMYQRGRRGNYIVMRSLNAGHYEVAVHEYTHFVMDHAGLKLPIWLNEGLAELYSTLAPRGEQCLIGLLQPGRLATLASQRRLDLPALFAVESDSPYYNDPGKMQIFYAESWALTHMLAVSEPYSKRFNAFVSMVSSGRPAREALRLVYGKELSGIDADLTGYLARRTMPALLYDIRVESTLAQAAVAPLPKAELDLSVADLLSSNAEAAPEAEAKVRELASAHPEEAGFEESLGYLALRKNQTDAARVHFGNAVERQSNDPVAIYNSARLQQDSGAPASQVIPMLQRVLALNPDYEPARIDLGFTAAKAKQFDLALATFARLKSLEPRLAFEVYFSMAYCDFELRRLQDARTYADEAQQYARTAEQRNRVDALLRFIDQPEVASLRR